MLLKEKNCPRHWRRGGSGDGPEREQGVEDFVLNPPLGRFDPPAKVAAVAVMLASDEAANLTAAEIHFDGGILAGLAVSPSADR